MSTDKLKPFPKIAIIGAGGVGSYLIPTLLRTIRNHTAPDKSPQVTIYDGDKLELKNMERQLFDESDIGKFKCEALAAKYRGYYPNIVAVPEFFSGGEALAAGTLIFVCVDNHPGRIRCLQCAGTNNCAVILCGNGYTDAEAMYFNPAWEGTPLDPRVYYPEIVTITADDPLRPEGCTGHAQQATPQLAIANFLAAGHALHLFWFWYQEQHKIDREFADHNPIRHCNNFTTIRTSKVLDLRPAPAKAA